MRFRLRCWPDLSPVFCIPVWDSGDSAGILTQLALPSINLRIMDKKQNVAINPDNYKLLVSLRNVKKLTIENPIFVAAVFTIVVIALLYWFSVPRSAAPSVRPAQTRT